MVKIPSVALFFTLYYMDKIAKLGNYCRYWNRAYINNRIKWLTDRQIEWLTYQRLLEVLDMTAFYEVCRKKFPQKIPFKWTPLYGRYTTTWAFVSNFLSCILYMCIVGSNTEVGYRKSDEADDFGCVFGPSSDTRWNTLSDQRVGWKSEVFTDFWTEVEWNSEQNYMK